MANLQDTTTGSIRTGVNGAVFTSLIVLLNAVFGWNITVSDLAPYLPLLSVVYAFFYRLSRLIADKVPGFGVLLFGVHKPPVYPSPPGVN